MVRKKRTVVRTIKCINARNSGNREKLYMPPSELTVFFLPKSKKKKNKWDFSKIPLDFTRISQKSGKFPTKISVFFGFNRGFSGFRRKFTEIPAKSTRIQSKFQRGPEKIPEIAGSSMKSCHFSPSAGFPVGFR